IGVTPRAPERTLTRDLDRQIGPVAPQNPPPCGDDAFHCPPSAAWRTFRNHSLTNAPDTQLDRMADGHVGPFPPRAPEVDSRSPNVRRRPGAPGLMPPGVHATWT